MNENPAFEMLRRFKDCDNETEKLVLSVVRKKYSVTQKEMYSVFESGIAGEYGKVYTLDPQTLIAWVDKYTRAKNSNKNYLETSLLDITTPSWETVDWTKEANKCFHAFLNGVSEQYFHHCVYDRMIVDGKIQLNAYIKKLAGEPNEQNIQIAKQRVLKEVFTEYKSKGFNTVYFIQ